MEKKGKSGHEQRWYVNVEEQQYGKGRLEAGVEDVKRGGGGRGSRRELGGTGNWAWVCWMEILGFWVLVTLSADTMVLRREVRWDLDKGTECTGDPGPGDRKSTHTPNGGFVSLPYRCPCIPVILVWWSRVAFIFLPLAVGRRVAGNGHDAGLRLGAGGALQAADGRG